MSAIQGLGFGSELVDNVSCFGHEVGAVLSSEIIEGTDIVCLFFSVYWCVVQCQHTVNMADSH